MRLAEAERVRVGEREVLARTVDDGEELAETDELPRTVKDTLRETVLERVEDEDLVDEALLLREADAVTVKLANNEADAEQEREMVEGRLGEALTEREREPLRELLREKLPEGDEESRAVNVTDWDLVFVSVFDTEKVGEVVELFVGVIAALIERETLADFDALGEAGERLTEAELVADGSGENVATLAATRHVAVTGP